jgi:hypothetical protein
MTTITSPIHSETITGWPQIGPLVSGMGSSLAFTILTGLAERPAFPPPSAFRTCYGPCCLSAQGKSRDLRHFSPMPTRDGNSVLRDMAHMVVCPIQTCIKHLLVLLSRQWRRVLLDSRILIQRCSKHIPLMVNWFRRATREAHTPFVGRAEGSMRSFSGSPFHALSLCRVQALCREGLEIV